MVIEAGCHLSTNIKHDCNLTPYTPPPILQGDYIWYSLNPETGFLTEASGRRLINDEGNTIMVGANGTYNGIMYSGRSVAVSGDGHINVPINATLGDELSNGDIRKVPGNGLTFTQIENGWHIVCDGTSTLSYLNLEFLTDFSPASAMFLLGMEAEIISGTLTYTHCYRSAYLPLPDGAYTVKNGHNELRYCGRLMENVVPSLYVDGGVPFEVKLTFPTIKEIQQVQGAVTYFDFATKDFIQPPLPFSTHYRLENGTYGVIATLHTSTFSQDDLQAFKQTPELLIAWYFGQHEIPSGLIRGINDKVYYPIGAYYLELGYTEQKISLVSQGNESPLDPNTVTRDLATETWTVHSEIPWDNTFLPHFQGMVDRGIIQLARHRVEINVSSGEMFLRDIGHNDEISHIEKVVQAGDLIVTNHIGKLREWGDKDALYVSTDGVNYPLCDYTLKGELFSVTSGYLKVEGTRSYNTRQAYGVQDVRFEMSDIDIPTKLNTSSQMRFKGKGDFINTGVSIDGSQSDFTMMLAFTLPETTDRQYIVVSGLYAPGITGISLYRKPSTPSNVLTAQIGDFSQEITFDISLPIHAMVAIYNKTTKQVQVAIDGSIFSIPIDTRLLNTNIIVFGVQSPTGINPFNGYMGEGILSATMEPETAWFAFWNRVQIDWCDRNKPVGQMVSNWTFDCGVLGWSYDPAYTAEITDNGDGSLHLKTTSNFGSLVPHKLPTESANWIVEVKFRNQIGDGKISFRRPNNVWISTPTLGDGVHTATYSGVIKELHIGADGDDTYEADYEYISLRKVDSNIMVKSGDTVTYKGTVLTH